MPFDVFISHSSRDKTVADAVCAVLEQAAIRCWIAPRDIEAGRDWPSSIMAALERCSIMVLVFSSHANASDQVKREVHAALQNGLTVIPFRVENAALSGTLQYYLGSVHWLDALSTPMDEHLRTLADLVKRNLTSRAARSPSAAPAGEPARRTEPAALAAPPLAEPSTISVATQPLAPEAGSARPARKRRRTTRREPKNGPAKKRPQTAAPKASDSSSQPSGSKLFPTASSAASSLQGTGMPSIVRAEFEQVRKMAELSRDPRTMVRLAKMYRDGHLGDWGKDDYRAVEWFRWAAETANQRSWLGSRFSDDSHAHAEAMNALAEMYEQGRGVTKDVNEAIRWYREAAKRWFSDAAKDAKASLLRLGVTV
jgi:TPR repeat protein